jgi:hypothetical protein
MSDRTRSAEISLSAALIFASAAGELLSAERIPINEHPKNSGASFRTPATSVLRFIPSSPFFACIFSDLGII